MNAFHSFWTKPNRLRNGGDVALPDYELLTLMLSALKWREKNGPIRMITDSAGAAFFERAGLSALWSEPPDTALDRMDPALDPRLFWAAGKLEALRGTDAPCVMLDTDLIVWEDVSPLLRASPVAAHWEALSPDVYPDPAEAFALAPGYAFPREWDFSLPAANTAFLYLPSPRLKAYYTDAAFRFMRALRGADGNPVVTMCFAEQRLLPLCARACGAEVQTLLSLREGDRQSLVTHLWGQKRALAASNEKRVEYCLSCALRIVTDFPAWEGALERCAQTAVYLEGLRAHSAEGGLEP